MTSDALLLRSVKTFLFNVCGEMEKAGENINK
jgi:hypothetical protein